MPLLGGARLPATSCTHQTVKVGCFACAVKNDKGILGDADTMQNLKKMETFLGQCGRVLLSNYASSVIFMSITILPFSLHTLLRIRTGCH